ncbi:hypothetical protein FA15DRAFT_674356 [Coprinopsis marcescibilis]|uniref:G-protein coupled receptors family 3 profile domain-containing protein n=1 Tax=Coprinopsis marcescibilis TaxID=230819 RepID=A0A5C3KH40_COPMA|nr:hypothetical protein FA15DRAFT_674356 [Coprinopsis marcescibilis]
MTSVAVGQAFFVLTYTGLALTIFSLGSTLTIARSKSKPIAEWYSCCAAAIVLAGSFGLLVGKFDTISRDMIVATNTCRTQAAIIYASPTLAPLTFAMLLLKSILSVRYHFAPHSSRRKRTISLATMLLPWVVYFVLLAVFTKEVIQNPDGVSLSTAGTHCHVSNQKLQRLSLTAAFCAMVVNSCLGGYICVLLYRSGTALKEAGGELQNAKSMSVRFAFLSGTILVLTICLLVFQAVFSQFKGNGAYELTVAILSFIFGMVFFTRKDILIAWLEVFRNIGVSAGRRGGLPVPLMF